MLSQTVEVCYVSPVDQLLIEIDFIDNMTIKDSIITCGILDQLPLLVLDQLTVGIFSQKKNLSDKVQAGDRIEIYRPLTIDPMESRRIRAEKKRKEKNLNLFSA